MTTNNNNPRSIMKLLPAYLQGSDTLNKFVQNTADHLFAPQQSETINGFIGEYPSYANPSTEFYINEPTSDRQYYSLEPITVSVDPTTNTVNRALYYQDLLSSINFNGGLVNDHDRLFNNEFYSWCPPIDLDQLMNYKQYYWMPYGPDAITITSSTNVDSQIVGSSVYPLMFTGSYVLPANPDVTIDGTKTPLQFTSGMRITLTQDINNSYNGNTYIIENVGVSTILILEPAQTNFSWDYLGQYTNTPTVLFITEPVDTFLSGIVGQSAYTFTGHYKTADSQHPWRPFNPYNPPNLSNNSDSLWEAPYGTVPFTDDMLIIFVTGYSAVDQYVYLNTMWKVTGVGTSINFVKQPYGWDTDGWGGIEPPFGDQADYIVMKRGAIDGNPWSTGNRWFHASLVNQQYIGTVYAQQAVRPIIDFDVNLELYNYGTTRLAPVDIKEDVLTFSQINGFSASNPPFMSQGTNTPYSSAPLSDFGVAPLLLDVVNCKNYVDASNPSYSWNNAATDGGERYVDLKSPDVGGSIPLNIVDKCIFFVNGIAVRMGYDYYIEDQIMIFVNHATPYPLTMQVAAVYWDTDAGILIKDGMTILITNDPNPAYNNQIYLVSGIQSTQTVILTPVDQAPVAGDCTRVLLGFKNIGLDFAFNGTSWYQIQSKNGINQPILFNLYDINAVALDDVGTYPDSTFGGNFIFGFTNSTNSAVPLDAVLNMRISYDNNGDIVYQNYIVTDSYYYGTNKNTPITGFYFHRNRYDSEAEYSNDWYLADVLTRQNIIHNYVATEGQTDFPISFSFTDTELLDPTSITVTVNGTLLTKNVDYTAYNGVVRIAIVDGGSTNFSTYFDIVVPSLLTYSIVGTTDITDSFVFWQPVGTTNQKLLVYGTDYTTYQNTLNFTTNFAAQLSVNDQIQVVLYDSIHQNDLVQIITYADRAPDQLVGAYEVPPNLQANPNWEQVETISLSQFFNQFTTIIENQKNFSGNVYGLNNYEDTTKDKSLGRDILQHRAPLLKTMLMASDDNIDYMLSVQYADHEYNRFKNKFITQSYNYFKKNIEPDLTQIGSTINSWVSSTAYGVGDSVTYQGVIYTCVIANNNVNFTPTNWSVVGNVVTPAIFVDTVLDSINIGKTNTFPFAYSTMVPGSQAFQVLNYVTNTVSGKNVYVIPTTTDVLAGAFVYLQQGTATYPTICVNGYDYTISGDEIIFDISIVFTNNTDTITVLAYEGSSTYVPPTPSHMGIYSVYKPGIVFDDTLLNPRNLIQCHDGSLVELYTGDYTYLNDVLLEFETRIYNSSQQFISRDYLRFFDHHNYVGGKFRSPEFAYVVDYTYQEWLTVLAPAFERWAVMNQLNYTNNTIYDPANPFTWNYSSILDTDGQPLPGHWRGIYTYFFDTDRPHTHPWEMVGLSQKPDWWDAEYGVAPYTKGNVKLWTDMEHGIIASGPNAGEYDVFARDNLLDYLPVDDYGNLLDPIAAGIASAVPTAAQAQSNWKFGDIGPAEMQWRRNSTFPFALAQAGYLIKPPRMIEYCWDTGRAEEIFKNQSLSNQWVYSDTRMRSPCSGLTVHGEITTAPNVYVAQGIQQWISDYLMSKGQDITTNFGNLIRGIDVRLGHKMAGFIDQTNMQVLADNFGLVPSENVTTVLYRSPSIADFTYSGVIITWTGIGWSVSGYDVVEPFFNTIPGNLNGNRAKIVVGRDAPLAKPWRTNFNYNINDVVIYQTIEYICIVANNSGSSFDGTNWSPLTVGSAGVTVVYYTDPNIDNTVYQVNYGTVFLTQQDVFDFLIDYGRYLTSQGWSFDQLDAVNNSVFDWLSSAKDYLFWSLVNWQPGNSIALSPGAKLLEFNTTFGEIQPVGQIVKGVYSLLNRDGFMIKNTDINVTRVAGDLQITPQNSQLIYLARASLSAVEHVIIFDNVTAFNDLIYNPLLNLRQSRFKINTIRSTNWLGRVDAPGFIVTGNNITPNFEKSVSDIQYIYGIEDGVENVTLRNYAWHVVGYEPRSYFSTLIPNPQTQFQFFQGAIAQKGAVASMDALMRTFYVANSSATIEFFDEWMFRVGNYGALTNKLTIELLLRQDEIKTDPQFIDFSAATPEIGDLPDDDVINIPLEVPAWTAGTFYSQYQEIYDPTTYNHYIVQQAYVAGVSVDSDVSAGYLALTENRWLVTPNRDLKTIFPMRKVGEVRQSDLPLAGYARVDEASLYATNFAGLQTVYNNLIASGSNINLFERVWVYSINNNWQLFIAQQLAPSSVYVTSVDINNTNYTMITTSADHNLTTGDIIVILGQTQATPDSIGVHSVFGVVSPTQFLINFVTTVGFNWTSQPGTGPQIYKLVPTHFLNMDQLNAYVPPMGWQNGDVVYIDNLPSPEATSVALTNPTITANNSFQLNGFTIVANPPTQSYNIYFPISQLINTSQYQFISVQNPVNGTVSISPSDTSTIVFTTTATTGTGSFDYTYQTYPVIGPFRGFLEPKTVLQLMSDGEVAEANIPQTKTDIADSEKTWSLVPTNTIINQTLATTAGLTTSLVDFVYQDVPDVTIRTNLISTAISNAFAAWGAITGWSFSQLADDGSALGTSYGSASALGNTVTTTAPPPTTVIPPTDTATIRIGGVAIIFDPNTEVVADTFPATLYGDQTPNDWSYYNDYILLNANQSSYYNYNGNGDNFYNVILTEIGRLLGIDYYQYAHEVPYPIYNYYTPDSNVDTGIVGMTSSTGRKGFLAAAFAMPLDPVRYVSNGLVPNYVVLPTTQTPTTTSAISVTTPAITISNAQYLAAYNIIVDTLYNQYLPTIDVNAPQNQQGVVYWIDAIQNGMTPDTLVQSFINSAGLTFTSGLETVSYNLIVTALYQEYFPNIDITQSAGQNDVNYWVNLLNEGITFNEVITTLINNITTTPAPTTTATPTTTTNVVTPTVTTTTVPPTTAVPYNVIIDGVIAPINVGDRILVTNNGILSGIYTLEAGVNGANPAFTFTNPTVLTQNISVVVRVLDGSNTAYTSSGNLSTWTITPYTYTEIDEQILKAVTVYDNYTLSLTEGMRVRFRNHNDAVYLVTNLANGIVLYQETETILSNGLSSFAPQGGSTVMNQQLSSINSTTQATPSATDILALSTGAVTSITSTDTFDIQSNLTLTSGEIVNLINTYGDPNITATLVGNNIIVSNSTGGDIIFNGSTAVLTGLGNPTSLSSPTKGIQNNPTSYQVFQFVDQLQLTQGSTVSFNFQDYFVNNIPSNYTANNVLTYSVTGGALPTGLSLQSNGILLGICNATGNYNFSITATNNIQYYTQNFSGTILADVIEFTNVANFIVTSNVVVNYGLTATSSSNNQIVYYVSSGALPTGLSLSAATNVSGLISGTPTGVAGTPFNFVITASDNYASTTQTFSGIIGSLAMNVNDLSFTIGNSVNYQFNAADAANDVIAYEYIGTLPPGLSLSGTGLLSGSPTVASGYDFTVIAYVVPVTTPAVTTPTTTSGFLINGGTTVTTTAAPTTTAIPSPNVTVEISGTVNVSTTNSSTTGGWVLLRNQIAKVDTSLFGSSLIYDRVTNDVLARLYLYDPAKGIIPGNADDEIYYRVHSDPAVYNNGDPTVYNVNPNYAWGDVQEYRLWWDLSTTIFLDYEIDTDDGYKKNVWGQIAPGTSIDIYEWTRSTIPPSQWATQVAAEGTIDPSDPDAYTGVVYNASNPAWSQKVEYNSLTKTYETVYYFWVGKKQTIPPVNWRKLSASTVSSLIETPTANGLTWYSPIDVEGLLVSGVEALLNDLNSVLQINYFRTPQELNIHRQWIIGREGDEDSQPDPILWNKMVDSLVGFDLDNLPVPDLSLSTSERYGTLYRPRQSWFIDQTMARTIFVNSVNSVFANQQMTASTASPYLTAADGDIYSESPLKLVTKNPAAQIVQEAVNVSTMKIQPVDFASTPGDTKNLDLVGGTFLGNLDGTYIKDGQRILIKDHATPSSNGIYIYHASSKTFTRTTDIVNYGTNVFVRGGVANRNTTWIQGSVTIPVYTPNSSLNLTYTNIIVTYFNLYLGRNPTTAEFQTYYSQMASGTTAAGIQTAILALPEYTVYEKEKKIGHDGYYLYANSWYETIGASEYHKQVDTIADMNELTKFTAANVSLNSGYKVLVTADPSTNGFWVIYYYNGISFVQCNIQKYKTSDFVIPTDWYASGYSSSNSPDYVFSTEIARDTYDRTKGFAVGDIVKIKASTGWYWQSYNGKAFGAEFGTWTLVAQQNGTIQLSSKFYTGTFTIYMNTTPTFTDILNRDGSLELRWVLKAILGDTINPAVFTALEINQLFYTMVAFAHTDNATVDWALKSSFLYVKGINQPLEQIPVQTPDNTVAITDYINEVKPYHSKIRDYTIVYQLPDEIDNAHVTDFDKPVYPMDRTTSNYTIKTIWNGDNNVIVTAPAASGINASSVTFTSSEYHVDWYNNFLSYPHEYLPGLNTLDGTDQQNNPIDTTDYPVRSFGITMCFDRISWIDWYTSNEMQLLALFTNQYGITHQWSNDRAMNIGDRVWINNYNQVSGDWKVATLKSPNYPYNTFIENVSVSSDGNIQVKVYTDSHVTGHNIVSSTYDSSTAPEYVVFPEALPEVVFVGDGKTKVFPVPFNVDHDLEVWANGKLLYTGDNVNPNNSYTAIADGVTVNYKLPIYLLAKEITITGNALKQSKINYVLNTDYTITNGTVTFNTAPAVGLHLNFVLNKSKYTPDYEIVDNLVWDTFTVAAPPAFTVENQTFTIDAGASVNISPIGDVNHTIVSVTE